MRNYAHMAMIAILAIPFLLVLIPNSCIGSDLKMISSCTEGDEEYTIPFESAQIFTDNSKTRMKLVFFKRSGSLSADTDDRLHIYILINSNQLTAQSVKQNTKAFFIWVQLYPRYGSMEIRDFELMGGENGRVFANGNGRSICESSQNCDCKTIDFSFTKIPLISVDSIDELNRSDYEFYQLTLKENFEEWGIP